jgi:hypothetical protein
MLNERLEQVSVYVVEPDDGDTELLLGDGEMLDQRSVHP